MKTIWARALLFAGVSILPALAGNQVLLRNLDSADGTLRVLAAGASGQLFVLSTLSSGVQQFTRAVELDLAGTRLASFDLTAMASPTAAITDPQGNLIVVGSDQGGQGIVVKVNAQLSAVTAMLSMPASIWAAAADASGNIYLTGATSSATFPITAGAFQTKPPTLDIHGAAAYAFVTEISPTGKVIYSTYFGSDSASCFGGSFCIGKYGVTSGTSIGLDSSGAVVIAGITTSDDLPTTASVLAQTCACGYNYSYGGFTAGFVAKFRPAATQQLVWSTYVNAAYGSAGLAVNAMALDSVGDVILGGSAASGLPTTPGAFRFPLASNPTSGAYLLKLNNTGAALVWGTYFDNSGGAVQHVAVDSQGRVVFSGNRANYSIPVVPYWPTFVGRATGDGNTLTDLYQSYAEVSPALAITSTGGFASIVQDDALWIETATPGPSILNVANSASGVYSSSLAPLELFTLYGIDIGPQTPINGQVQNGVYTTSLGGYQVLFNGVALPLLYADSHQINTIVPAGAGLSPQIQIVTPSGTIDGPKIPITYSPVPAIFQNSQTGRAVALNQDGSINSTSNPAKTGTIVTVFADANSGAFFPDGSIVPLAIYDAGASVWVSDFYRSLEVIWAGAAPGIVNGVMQINFRLPETVGPVTPFTFSIAVGGVWSLQSAIAVAP